MLHWILLISLLLLQTACDTSGEAERPQSSLLAKPIEQSVNSEFKSPKFDPLQSTSLLNEPTPVHAFETTAEALTIWRRGVAEKPTLLLLSNNPHLRPVPEELRKAAEDLINNAKLETIQINTSDRTPSPLLLPDMALDVAMRNNWFREVAWALPLRDPAQDLDLEKFKVQLTDSDIANDEEIETIVLNERIFVGRLRDIPFRAAALPLIKNLTGPVIVHIDLSYFQPLYKNEISTPLLDIIFQTIQTLKKMNIEALAVTLSYGHLDSQIALDVRFLGEVISYLIEDPKRLDQDIPLNWQRQRDTLYLANFFQKNKIRELFEAQEKDEPDAAYVKFNLYRSAAEHKEGTKALDYLAEAVNLDPIYALEYLDLSNMAYDKQRPDEALRMLELSAEVFHEDPFLKLQMAILANELGDKENALDLLNKVRNLTWSDVFYPHMPQYLANLMTFTQTGRMLNQPSDTQPASEDNSKQRSPSKMETSRQRTLHKQ